MPSRAPSHRELELLRYLAVGMRFDAPPLGRPQLVPLVAKGVTVTTVQVSTVKELLRQGWIAEAAGGVLLTARGRDVAECKAFVRAFAEGATP